MQITFAALAALLPALAFADHIDVKVGENGLTFDPTNVEAEIGDVVSFIFYPRNHTVTQSTFAAPCTPLQSGADSNYQPLSTFDSAAPIRWNYTVASSNATWFYCAQKTGTDHCKAGMVFAINPTAERTYEQFAAAAKSGVSGAPASSGAVGSGSGTTGGTPAPSGGANTGGQAGDDGSSAVTSQVALPLLAVLGLVGLAL